jgi:glutamyl-tRNA reductase
VITRPMAERIIRHRKNKPVFFIYIAVPRDIDPAVNEIDNVFLYDIDDLQQVIDANLKERLKEAHRAEEIIDGEVQAFCTRMQSREVVPTIVEMRATLEKQRHDEIERYRKKLKDFTPEQLAIVDQITESLVNKILHSPITQLKGMAHDPRGAEFAEAVRKLFNIKSSSPESSDNDEPV